MTGLEQWLEHYRPPPVPADLAKRAAAAASGEPETPKPARMPWRRRHRRDGWRRSLLVGGAAMGLALTSAVAATVASGGRIEIPVVREMVAAVPVLRGPPVEPRPPVVERQTPSAEDMTAALAEAEPPEAGEAPEPLASEGIIAPSAERYARVREKIEQRRAAGLPTPHADRIEAAAKAIVDRRQAKGLSVQPVEDIEARLVVRAYHRARITRALVAQMSLEERAAFRQLTRAEQRQLLTDRLRNVRARQPSTFQDGQRTDPPASEGDLD